MSTSTAAQIGCPACGESFQTDRAVSVDAARNPESRAAILDKTFQVAACPHCHRRARLPPGFTYIDLAAGQWIAAHPFDDRGAWSSFEESAHLAWDEAMGPGTPAEASGLAAKISPRIVFGWPALREKLLCVELGVRDDALEVLKLWLLRQLAYDDRAAGVELRLSGGDAERLDFSWVDGSTEEVVLQAGILRNAYEALLSDPEIWTGSAVPFAGQLFVDSERLLAAPADVE